MKPESLLWKLLLLPVLAVVLQASDCGSASEEIFSGEEDEDIRVILKNLDDTPVHLFSRFEPFPSCRVLPDSSRCVLIVAREGERIECRAGRLQQILDTHQCTVRASQLPDEGEEV